jgi:hypothetical protein
MPNEAIKAITVKPVVSNTKGIDNPSTPTRYWTLKAGIQATRSTNCMVSHPPAAPSKRDHAIKDTASDANAAPTAVVRKEIYFLSEGPKSTRPRSTVKRLLSST